MRVRCCFALILPGIVQKNADSGPIVASSPRGPMALEKGAMGQSTTSALPVTIAAARSLSQPAKPEDEASAARTRSESKAIDTSARTMSSPNQDQGTLTPAFANIFGSANKSISETAAPAHDGGGIQKSNQQEAVRKVSYMWDATTLGTLEVPINT